MMRWIACFILVGTLAAQEIRRPSVSANTASSAICTTGTNITNSTTMPFAYDAGTPPTATQSSLSRSSTNAMTNTRWTGRVFSSWAAASAAYTALTVNINLACSDSSAGLGACGAEYSLNSGSSWTSLASVGDGTAQTTYSASISAGTTLSNVEVRICTASTRDDINAVPTTATIFVWDIWTSGTLTAAAVPKHRARSY